jgi:hypothetical protein
VYQSVLNSLRDTILEYNPYLAKGYADVVKDETLGIIHSTGDVIFPNDTDGDYFYIRTNGVQFTQAPEYKADDCSGSLGIQMNCVLVAIMGNANPDSLLKNMVSSLRLFNNDMVFSNAIFTSAGVIVQELNADVRAQALKRLSGKTIVSIVFSMTEMVMTLKAECIENPCTC